MARKNKKAILQSPPPAPSSSDDTSSSADDTSSSADDTSHPLTAPSSIPTATKSPLPQPSDDGDSDDHSSPSSDSPPNPNPKPKHEPNPKPLVSAKPETERMTVIALPSTSMKRPSENKTSESKKAKKEKPSSGLASSNDGAATTPTQKVMFQRVWSVEDEIMILEGLIEYRGKYGVDPMSNPDDFFDFIKRSVHVPDVNKNQLVRKVKSMKNKFNHARLKSQPLKNPKDLEAFFLGKRIWDCEFDTVPVSEDNGPALKPKKANGHALKPKKVKDGAFSEEEEDKDEGNVKNVRKFGKFENSDVGLIDVESMFSEASGAVVKRLMKKLEGDDKEEMMKKVRKANVASLEAYLSRLDVLDFVAKKMLDDVRTN